MVVDAGAVVAAVVVTGGGCCVWKDEKEENCIYGNECALVGVRHCSVLRSFEGGVRGVIEPSRS